MSAWLASNRSAVGPRSGSDAGVVAALTMYSRVQVMWSSHSLRIASWKAARLGLSAVAWSVWAAAPGAATRIAPTVARARIAADAAARRERLMGGLLGSGPVGR